MVLQIVVVLERRNINQMKMIQFRLFHLVAMTLRAMIGIVKTKMLKMSWSKTTMGLMTQSLTYWNPFLNQNPA